MTSAEILGMRLYCTGLGPSRFKTVADAVTHLGAVQAQDFAAAKWSLGLRVGGSTDEAIDEAFDEGTILRIHVMRPTWHFVMPADIRWITELTAPRVKASLASSNRKLGLDEVLFARSNAAIVKALQGHDYRTRQELKTILAAAGIETDVQRLAHLIMRAELDGLVCSGPRRGKQFTYALLDERVPRPETMAREEALAKHARTYFGSHGPAQVGDFAWWSGLAVKDALMALDMIKPDLVQATLNGKTYWYVEQTPGPIPKPPPALLLSVYDEYTIAYKDRSDISERRFVERMISMGNALTAVIILDGQVAGTWKKVSKRNTIEIKVDPFRKLTQRETEAVDAEIARYEKFIGLPVVRVAS